MLQLQNHLSHKPCGKNITQHDSQLTTGQHRAILGRRIGGIPKGHQHNTANLETHTLKGLEEEVIQYTTVHRLQESL